MYKGLEIYGEKLSHCAIVEDYVFMNAGFGFTSQDSKGVQW